MSSNQVAESGESRDKDETREMTGGQKVRGQVEDGQESCTSFLSPELLQRKYKCFIIYAISIISIIELILLMFSNENSSSKNIMDVLARYVNRTQSIM